MVSGVLGGEGAGHEFPAVADAGVEAAQVVGERSPGSRPWPQRGRRPGWRRCADGRGRCTCKPGHRMGLDVVAAGGDAQRTLVGVPRIRPVHRPAAGRPPAARPDNHRLVERRRLRVRRSSRSGGAAIACQPSATGDDIGAQPPLGTATGPTRAGRHAVPPLVTVSSQTSLCRPSETSAHAEMSESDHAIGQARYRSWCDDGPRFALADSGDRRNTRRLEELRWQGEVGRDRATPRLRHAIRQARRAQRSLHPAAIKVWLHCLERHL